MSWRLQKKPLTIWSSERIKAEKAFDNLDYERKKVKDNIVLIGMPGCGKSTVGIVLAKALGYQFLDSDLLIQNREKRLLCEIIEQEGLDRFNQIEEEVNASIQAKRTVIATGGSVVYGPSAMGHLKEIGTVVYMKLSLPAVQERLGDLTRRGVSFRPNQTLSDLYEERIPLYEKYADHIVDEEGMDIRRVVRKITQIIEQQK